MNILLWILQILLAVFFFMAGFGKLSSRREKHIADGHIRPGQSLAPIRVLGLLELLGSIGIILPWLSGMLPLLTPITALCFGGIMLAGMVVHSRKKEYKMLPMLALVLAIALLVAYYRFSLWRY